MGVFSINTRPEVIDYICGIYKQISALEVILEHAQQVWPFKPNNTVKFNKIITRLLQGLLDVASWSWCPNLRLSYRAQINKIWQSRIPQM